MTIFVTTALLGAIALALMLTLAIEVGMILRRRRREATWTDWPSEND
jgi:hypothetical protein